ncbi:hypothetical protein [Mesorhizobium liriopis]|nr:hypothetical protein [Mesorhizobium liriopis]
MRSFALSADNGRTTAAKMKKRCVDILADPASYDGALVGLCAAAR